MDNSSAIKTLLRKIKALTDKGNDGEKANAEKILADLLQKNGLTIEDLEKEQPTWHSFKVSGKVQTRLLNQIVGKVNRNLVCHLVTKSSADDLGLRGRFAVKCTPAEFVEIEQMYAVYSRLYEKELKVFYLAFLSANKLLLDRLENDEDTPSQDEIEEANRAARMGQYIKSESVRKAITSGSYNE